MDNTAAEMVPRTRGATKKKKRTYLLMSTSGTKGCNKNARTKAKVEGVNLDVENGFWGRPLDEAWVFGPNPQLDNVYQNCPQVTLHGMDEGLTSKLNLGAVEMVVAELKISRPKWFLTTISRKLDELVLQNVRCHTSNKNVELGGRDAFKRFRHGIVDYILGERRCDGGWHIAMSRQLHIAICTMKELRKSTRQTVGRAYELLFAVHHGLRCSLPAVDVDNYDATIAELLDVMLEINVDSTDGDCKSPKYHWPRHWAHTRRELGCAAAEKSLERKLGQSQKRNFRFTNKQEATCEVISCPCAGRLYAEAVACVTTAPAKLKFWLFGCRPVFGSIPLDCFSKGYVKRNIHRVWSSKPTKRGIEHPTTSNKQDMCFAFRIGPGCLSCQNTKYMSVQPKTESTCPVRLK